jgi:hypothetical protein
MLPRSKYVTIFIPQMKILRFSSLNVLSKVISQHISMWQDGDSNSLLTIFNSTNKLLQVNETNIKMLL